MERDYKEHYYRMRHENQRSEFNQNNRNRNFRDDLENNYREPGRNQFQNEDNLHYRNQDYDMERNYYSNVGNSGNDLGYLRQGYGFTSFGGSHDHTNRLDNMEREREYQRRQGYGSGRMGGYSGSAFGGANYSSHGDFGGAPEYGAMSGYGGNSDDHVSSSGYGGGYNDTNSNRNNPNYAERSSYASSQGNYSRDRRYGGKNYGSNSGYSDRQNDRDHYRDDNRHSNW